MSDLLEQDFLMRQITAMVRAIFRFLLNRDMELPPAAGEVCGALQRQTLDELLYMVDAGLINEAENRVFEMTEDGGETSLEIALRFYDYLNDKPDEFLEAHGFSRDEIGTGLRDLAARYGAGDLARILL